MRDGRDDRSLGDLFADLARELGELVRQEAQLAKAELRQNATQASRAIAALVVGGAIVYAGVLALLAAAILGLGQAGLPWWLAALVVGVVVVVLGALVTARARAALQTTALAPQQTIETLKEDRAWVNEQIR
jgi:Putative Actinobacterial Holin-X, holin superfamily III